MQVCPAGTYTLRASAEGYVTQERLAVIGASSVEDFILSPVVPAPDLAGSTKAASTASLLPGETLTYTLVAENATTAAGITITDTLPVGLEWSGALTATFGLPAFAEGRITWAGVLTPSQPLTITYNASVAACLPGGAILTNLAEFDNRAGTILARFAEVQVLNAAPEAPALLGPDDGAEQQPLQMTLAWQAPADLNCDPLTYTLYLGVDTPLPVASGLTTTTFTTEELLPGITYTWYVVASDGQASASSPVWHFTTAPQAPTPLRFFIPYLSRNH